MCGASNRLLLSSTTTDNTAQRLADSLSLTHSSGGDATIIAKQADFVIAVSKNTDYVERIKIDGTTGATNFTGNVTSDGTIGFNLEPDDDSNYVTTTDADGNETRVYNGPTLDVKAVIQELQQRVADRDAVIADVTARLAALEADHATMMGNDDNGGY